MNSISRTTYVFVARRVRSVAERLTLVDRLEAAHSGRARHLRTLFAIHDLDDLVHLDLPWWVYGAAERVDRFIADRDGKAKVFEYGSGASTLWLARRAHEVHSVEHHAEFADLMAGKVADLPNVSLRHVPAKRMAAGRQPPTPSRRFGQRGLDYTDYVRSIDAVDGEFDLIVVDGRAREECLRRSVERLAPGGIVLFDNSNRRRYQQALRSSGLAIERIRGAAPSLPYRTETALLTRHPDRPG
jgi:Methyltransferase domain